MIIDHKTIIALAVVAFAVYYYGKKEVAQAAATVGRAVNPVSNENIFYKFAGSVTGALTGSNQPLGTQIYDYFHED